MKFEGNYLLINTNGWDYDIPANDLKTVSGLEKWLCHMNEKVWFKESMCRYMISLCEHKFGYKFTGKLYY